MNEEVLSTADNFLALRDKYSPETASSQFRKQVVGGVNLDDVTNYITQMKDDYKKFEREMRNEINDLLSSKIQLERQLEEKQDLQLRLDKAQSDLFVYIEECRTKDEILESIREEKGLEISQLQNQICQMAEQREDLKKLLSEAGQEISRLMDETERIEGEKVLLQAKADELEKGCCEVFEQQIEVVQQKNMTLEHELSEKASELEELRRIAEDAVQELNHEKARVLNDEITGFKYEVAGIYKKIENIAAEQSKINSEIQLQLDQQDQAKVELLQQLDEQASINSEISRQLDIERLRAIKAEDDRAALVRCIAELKDSLYSGQALLEAQLSQVETRHGGIN